ncbi:hypothetical protein ACTL6U_01185 [Rhodovibrionaceae bacterium A322]
MERNEALTRVQEAISLCDGWVVNHQLFSNIAASLIFEIPVPQAQALLTELAARGLPPSEDAKGRDGPGSNDLRGSIALTFLHNDPDLKRPVPAFG